jgi:magnesium transporter
MTWIDLESPTNEEIKEIMHKYSVHPLVADELLRPTIRPKVDVYKNITYLILHFPIFDSERKGCRSCEINFILGKNFLITTRYESIGLFFEMSKIFEANVMLQEDLITKNSGVLFFHIIRQLYGLSLRQLDHIHTKINQIEDKMFSGFEYDIVKEISLVRRDTLDFRRTIFPHKEVLSSFDSAGKNLYGKDFIHYVNNLIGEFYKTWNTLESNNETIESLQETVDSLLTHKTNEVMKTLTIMAFVTFPLMLIASMFGMNTKYLPIVGTTGDFWIIIGIMAIATATMFSYFKKRKWL